MILNFLEEIEPPPIGSDLKPSSSGGFEHYSRRLHVPGSEGVVTSMERKLHVADDADDSISDAAISHDIGGYNKVRTPALPILLLLRPIEAPQTSCVAHCATIVDIGSTRIAYITRMGGVPCRSNVPDVSNSAPLVYCILRHYKLCNSRHMSSFGDLSSVIR